MATKTDTKPTDAPTTTEAAPTSTYKPVALRNKSRAPLWIDDVSLGLEAQLPGAGVALDKPVLLTEKQWRRRTPADWGILVAKGDVELRNIPPDDQAAVDAAEDRELSRAGAARTYSEAERAFFNPKL